MPLLSWTPSRYVLLLVDDERGAIAARVEQAPIHTELLRCPTLDDARSAVARGRRYSAVLAPAGAGIGSDLRLAERGMWAGTPVVAVERGASPVELAAAIEAVAEPVPRFDRPRALDPDGWPAWSSGGRRPVGRLVAVCGPGGTGTSTIAAALALAWGTSPAGPRRKRVLLADLALRADQAYFSGLDDPVGGLDDPVGGLLPLVETARLRPIGTVDARTHTTALVGCRLLPGLRRSGHWTAVSPGGFDTVLAGLLGVFDVVVADITGDFEGETETGSVDVEERNHMARRSAGAADVVVVVAVPGPHGTRRAATVVNELLDLGVDPARIQPVINKVVPDAVRPAELWVRTHPQLSGPTPELPDRARMCGLPALRIGLPLVTGARDGRLPPAVAQPLLAALTDLLTGLAPPDAAPVLVPVTPGSLGCAVR